MLEIREGIKRGALAVGLMAFMLAVWELGVRLLAVPLVILPPPSSVFAEFFGSNFSLILQQAIPTGLQVISGFAFASIAGVMIAIMMARWELLRMALQPYLIGLQVVPKIALAPLFIFWFGIGFLSRFAFAAFICFFPVVIATAAGLRDTPPEAIRMCRAIGATDTQVMFGVRLPFATPYIFTGLKISATMSVIGVVIGEFISADRGLGFLILHAVSRSETPLVLAAIGMLCLIGFSLFGIVVFSEKLVGSSQRGDR